MDPEPFEKLAATQTDLIELNANHERYSLVCHQVCYALRAERQYVGIFVNINDKMTHYHVQMLNHRTEFIR